MIITCEDWLAKFLIGVGGAKEYVPVIPKTDEPKTVPKPSDLLPWYRLIASVKASDMTEAMKVACVAQAIIESGRGTSRVTADCCNFWGIKMRPELEGMAVGRIVKVTSEVEGMAVFAAFESTDIAVKGWLKFLSRSYYKGWEAYKNDSESFLKHIGESWCPVDGYAEKVIKCIPEAKNLLGVTVATSGKKRLLLDPGHSEKHTGARSNDKTVEEEDLNRLQAAVVKQELEATGRFECTIFDPLDDNLSQIGQKAKDYDAFISIHLNAFSGSGQPGTEVFVTTYANEMQIKAAKMVCDSICKELGTTNRGVKKHNWTVINEADKLIDGPVMLIEAFFVTNMSLNEATIWATRAAKATAKALGEVL
jgi:N-acetylmuramoyl-L-alanine amidase